GAGSERTSHRHYRFAAGWRWRPAAGHRHRHDHHPPTENYAVTQVAHYCPLCGGKTELRQRSGAMRPVCTLCDHIVYFNPGVAVAVCILQDDQILLVRRGMEPMRGYWAMPAGFMEYDED